MDILDEGLDLSKTLSGCHSRSTIEFLPLFHIFRKCSSQNLNQRTVTGEEGWRHSSISLQLGVVNSAKTGQSLTRSRHAGDKAYDPLRGLFRHLGEPHNLVHSGGQILRRGVRVCDLAHLHTSEYRKRSFYDCRNRVIFFDTPILNVDLL